ncbi:thiamine-phosphate kinase [Micrococcaceae bacterium RIT802]|nr:thiamine-phosphate kinase [Micrococcaceae bacterium RIT 802]
MVENNDDRHVAGLGESGLLRLLLPRLHGAEMLLGPGDDAAHIAAPGGSFVISIDTMVQDQDFRLRWQNGSVSTGYDVGWKSAAQNLSDINAMGAVATSAVLSLTLPAETPVVWVEEFADGFSAAVRDLRATECAVAGGDLSAGRELSVSTAVTGRLVSAAPILRSGARPGDVVTVCGRIGAAAAGFALLESSVSEDQMNSVEHGFVAGQHRPRPNLAAGPLAADRGATAMMDLSDGLRRDLPRLAESSGVAVALDAQRLEEVAAPDLFEWASGFGYEPEDFLLRAGEDFALLATFPTGTELPECFTPIGTIIGSAAGGMVLLDGRPLEASGWDHFSQGRSQGSEKRPD